MLGLLIKRYRVLVLLGVFGVFYLLIGWRLWTEQLRSGDEYSKAITDQTIRRVRLPGNRGRLYFADGPVLADNLPAYHVMFHLSEMRVPGPRDRTVARVLLQAKRLAVALKRDSALTEDDILRQWNLRPAMPLCVFEDLTAKELAIASELSPPIAGMEIVVAPKRVYPSGKLACHAVGYCGKDDPSRAEDREEYSYYVPDLKGRQGLEKKLDEVIDVGAGYRGLRGEPGEKLLLVDSREFAREDLGTTREPIFGNDTVLTLESKAQEAAEAVLADRSAALVALDANTGAVIAMASAPGYDPSWFVNGISAKAFKVLLKDPEHPLVNRALSSYMPGSIAKPLVALAALKDGASPEETFFCDGAVPVGNTRIRCWSWEHGGHGDQNMIDGLKNSCNVYFVSLGKRLGLEKIAEMFAAAGLGRPTGVGLPESAGVFPTEAGKKRLTKQSWTLYDTCLISIGQGLLKVTPLQAALYAAAIGNGGTLWQPYLIKEVRNPSDKLLFETVPKAVGRLPVTPDQIDIVREGMRAVVQDPRGTGKLAKTEAIALCGKTGTAQVQTAEGRFRQTWFIGFGEANNRLYAIAVTVDDGVGGSFTCAPIAKAFFERYLDYNAEAVAAPAANSAPSPE